MDTFNKIDIVKNNLFFKKDGVYRRRSYGAM